MLQLMAQLVVNTMYLVHVSPYNLYIFELIRVCRNFQAVTHDFLIRWGTNVRWHIGYIPLMIYQHDKEKNAKTGGYQYLWRALYVTVCQLVFDKIIFKCFFYVSSF